MSSYITCQSPSSYQTRRVCIRRYSWTHPETDIKPNCRQSAETKPRPSTVLFYFSFISLCAMSLTNLEVLSEECQWKSDGRTDELPWQYRALCVASRGKNHIPRRWTDMKFRIVYEYRHSTPLRWKFLPFVSRLGQSIVCEVNLTRSGSDWGQWNRLHLSQNRLEVDVKWTLCRLTWRTRNDYFRRNILLSFFTHNWLA